MSGGLASRRRWSREELLLAMNLYCRIPFGRQHSRAPEVLHLAKVLGRSPGSVAMKLNNFTSLDPKERERGVRGLSGTSKLDRQVWDDFHADWEVMAAESERLWQDRVGAHVGEIPSAEVARMPSEAGQGRAAALRAPVGVPTGPTEGERMTVVRYAQGFFRRTVLVAYGVKCCITGIPVPELLIASHILPWSEFREQRINPRNGLCLSRLHDAALDQGLIAFDEDSRLLISRELRDYLSHNLLRQSFSVFEGQTMRLPEKFAPDEAFLRYHREHRFRG